MSGDPEQEYFADGVVEDIITALSRFKSLFVIARNSSFAYKGKTPDVRQVGRDLGVKSVLEGSVRRAGHRLRITAQLIDAQSGAHVWADRFEGSPADIFDFQDEVTEKVVIAIAPRLERTEIARALRRSSLGSADAYDYFLKALASLPSQTAQNTDHALDLLGKATALDPDFASAYALAMVFHANRISFGKIKDLAQEKNEVVRLWRIVARVGSDDGRALADIQAEFDKESIQAIEGRAQQRAAAGQGIDAETDKQMALADAYAFRRIQEPGWQENAAVHLQYLCATQHGDLAPRKPRDQMRSTGNDRHIVRRP